MSFNGSGTFLINTAGQPVVSGTVISSTAFNALTADLATGLSTAITKDGQTTVTANIPMSTYKFTGLGVGSAATDSANLSQVQSTVTKLLNSVSGADTITATASPTLAAYAAGQMFYFVAAGDNTTSVTLNIDSLGAKAVTRDGSVALAAADIKSGEVIVVVYDGTRFQVVSQLNSAGNATFANVSITSALNVGGVATFSAGTAAAPSITTTGDTNTGIFFPAADTIAFTEGGTESFRVNSSGNMGLGTTNPTNTAGFSRQVQIDGTTSCLTLNGTTGSGKYSLGVPGANAVGLWDNTASAYRWYVDSSGNVGIGLTNPVFYSGRLTVDGGNIALASAGRSLFWNAGGTGVAAIQGVGTDALAFQTSNSYTEQMRLTTTGLGIGTASPAVKLQVAGAIRSNSSVTGPLANLHTSATNPASTGASGNGLNLGYDSNSENSWIQANRNGISETRSLLLNPNGGGVGISEGNTPTQILSLYRAGSTNAIMSAGNSNTGLNGTLFGVDTAGNGIVNQTQVLPLIFSTSNTERARITSGGYSKFSNTGTYSNSALYHEFYQTNNNTALLVRATNATFSDSVTTIQGDRTTTNTSYYLLDCYNGNVSGRFRVADSGNATNTNGSYGTISDAKMKTDIVDAGSQWDDIKAVRFRKFKMKDDPSGLMQLGVVAQELEQTSPGLVDEHADKDAEGNDLGTTTKSVKSSILLMKAAKALQEAMARIETLEAKVTALESK